MIISASNNEIINRLKLEVKEFKMVESYNKKFDASLLRRESVRSIPCAFLSINAIRKVSDTDTGQQATIVKHCVSIILKDKDIVFDLIEKSILAISQLTDITNIQSSPAGILESYSIWNVIFDREIWVGEARV